MDDLMYSYNVAGQELSDSTCTSDRLQMLLDGLKTLSDRNSLTDGTCLSYMEDVQWSKAWENLWRIRNANCVPILMAILRILVADESSAQHVWTSLMKYSGGYVITLSVMEILCLCAKRGAQPKVEEVQKILERNEELSLYHITRSEELTLAFLKTLAALHHKNRLFTCDLQFLSDFYVISQEMLQLGRQLVHAVYGTFDSCLKSGKLIDILLFISNSNKGTEILIPELSCENWLMRSPLHLAAIILESKKAWKCLPRHLIEKHLRKKDLHGCTPLHMAHLHHNERAIQFLIAHVAERDVKDEFGMTPECLGRTREHPSDVKYKGLCCLGRTTEYNSDVKYKELCCGVVEAKCGILQEIRPLLVQSEIAAEALSGEVKTLFERLIRGTQFKNAEIVVAGSVREKLKAGCLDEVDVILKFIEKVSKEELLVCLIMRLSEISFKGINLRPISVHGPWKFLRDGMTVSLDVVVVFVEKVENIYGHRLQGQLLWEDHPLHRKMVYFTLELETWNFRGDFSFKTTYFAYEWDMIDSLPASCRLAIVIAKALLQAYDLCRGDILRVKLPITSYMIKTALFYILAYRSGQLDLNDNNLREALHHVEGNVDRFKIRPNKLMHRPQPKWVTDEDVDKHGKEAGVWGKKIFTLIQYLAQQKKKLNSYWEREASVVEMLDYGEAECIKDICDCALERLNPNTFSSSEWQGSVRIRMQDSSYEPCMVFVSGDLTEVKKELLTLYLENAAQAQIQEIMYGVRPGIARIEFKTEIDYQALKNKVWSDPMDGVTLEVSRVERSTVIQVFSSVPREDKLLNLYFINKQRSGGSDKAIVKRVGELVHLVDFGNATDAKRVVGRQHCFEDGDLIVALHYDALGLIPPGYDTSKPFIEIPDDKVINRDPLLVKYIKEGNNIARHVNESLKKHYGQIDLSHPAENEIKIKCLLKHDMDDIQSIAKQWQDEVSRALENVLEAYGTRTVSCSPKSWQEVYDQVCKYKEAKKHTKLMIKENKHNYTVDIIGPTENLHEALAAIEQIWQDIQEKQNVGSKDIDIPFRKLKVLQKLGITNEIKKQWPQVKVVEDHQAQKITLNGNNNDILNAALHVHTKLQDVEEHEVPMSKLQIKVLNSTNGLQYMDCLLRANKLITEIEPCVDKVIITGPKAEIHGTSTLLTNEIVESIEPISEGSRLFVRGKGWDQFVERCRKKSSMVQLEMAHDLTSLKIAGIFDKHQEFKKAFAEYLKVSTIKTEFIPAPRGCIKLLSRYSQKELMQIELDCVDFHVNIQIQLDETKNQECGIIMRGALDGLGNAMKLVHSQIKSVMTQSKIVSQPGLPKFLMSDSNTMILCGVENTYEVVIEVSDVDIGSYSVPNAAISPQMSVLDSVVTRTGNMVKVILGDLTEHKVDAVVNPANPFLKHKGGLSRALAEKGGDSIQKECDAYIKSKISLRIGDAMKTKAGKLPCKWIIHTLSPHWNGGKHEEENILYDCVQQCLKLAQNEGMKSIAFPAIGAGIYGWPVERSTKTIVEAVSEFSSSDWQIKEIHLVGDKEDIANSFAITLANKFETTEATKQLQAATGQNNGTGFGDSEAEGSKPTPASGDSATEAATQQYGGSNLPSAKLDIFAFKEENIAEAVDAIDELWMWEKADQILGGAIDPNTREIIRKLQGSEQKAIKEMARGTDVRVTVESNRKTPQIRIEGQLKDVAAVESRIKGYLHQLEMKKHKREEAQLLFQFVQWEYEEKPGVFTPYSEETNIELEKVFAQKKESVAVVKKIDDQKEEKITVDLQNKSETDGTGKKKAMRRRDLSQMAYSLPDSWSQMSEGERFTKVELKKNDQEYLSVAKAFNLTWPKKFNMKIERLQNPILYRRYIVHKKDLEKESPNIQAERMLWHGTNRDVIDNICFNGFNRSYHGANGRGYGKGVYFSAEAPYSVGFAMPDAQAQRYLFYASVLTGEYCVGNPAMVEPPPKDPAKPHILYDSTVNMEIHPAIFVVYRDTQVYPHYLITLM